MARPNKVGLDYFPLDVDYFSDPRIQALAGKYGVAAELFLIRLWCRIYSENFFLPWTDLEIAVFAANLPIPRETIDGIIADALEWNLFDKEKFEQFQILTSRSIQQRFIHATTRRTEINVNKKYLCKGVSVRKNTTKNRIEKNRIEKEIERIETSADAKTSLTESLGNWWEYRRQIRKPLSESSLTQILKKYSGNPGQLKIDVDFSIQQGWQGLFAPNGHTKSKADERKAKEDKRDAEWFKGFGRNIEDFTDGKNNI